VSRGAFQEGKRDHYEVLGVARDATQDEIRTAFRRLMVQYHPDRNPGDREAEKRFKEVAEAYSVLSDPDRRHAYDRFGHSASTPAAAGYGGHSFDRDLDAAFGRDVERVKRGSVIVEAPVSPGGPASGDRTKAAASIPSTLGTSWNTLRGYLYRVGEEPEILRDAGQFAPREDRSLIQGTGESRIMHGSLVTVMLWAPDAECQTSQEQFLWQGTWRAVDFGLRRRPGARGGDLVGTLSWFVGLVCVAQVSFRIAEAASAMAPTDAAFSSALGYEAVFVSYSHADAGIVDMLDAAYTALGMKYLRDVKTLRSGETWNPRLLALIGEADLFQLCWSANASRSTYVAEEWRHALGRGSAGFIRPLYWEEPMPAPPPELRHLHFAKFSLQSKS
jgi:hypothetical protein